MRRKHTRRWSSRSALAALAVAVVLPACLPGRDATAEAALGGRAAEGGFYDPSTVPTIAIHFDSPDWERELEMIYGTDEEIPATVTVDGTPYREVGVSFRGMSSYRRVDTGSKRSLNLSFDFAHDGQAVGGYRTLNLLNALNDPTFMRTVLYSRIAREYIPAPKVNYARVTINGESWGIYLNAQQFNKDFLRDFYDTDEGARWKVPGSPRGRGGLEYLGAGNIPAYRLIYEIRSKDEEASWERLIELTRILNETPADELEEALEPILDVDGALKFLAVEVALANSDGYWSRASDYNLYLDPDGRFHVIPHDMNEALGVRLGGGGRGGFGGGGGFESGGGAESLDPLVAVNDPTKPLRSKLLDSPELRARYLAHVRDIATKWLDWTVIEPIVRESQALIAAEVHADERKLYDDESFVSGVEDLRSFFDRRRAFLLR